MDIKLTVLETTAIAFDDDESTTTIAFDDDELIAAAIVATVTVTTTMTIVDAHVLRSLTMAAAAVVAAVASVYFGRVLNVLTNLNWQLCLMIRTLESGASAVVNDLVHVQVLSMLSFDLSFLLNLSPNEKKKNKKLS